MGLRIRLVEPRPAGHNVYDRSLLPRLGLPLMAKMLVESSHDVRIYCEILAPVDLDDLLAACGCPFGWDTPDMPDVVVCPKHGSTRVASGSSSETRSGGPLPIPETSSLT